MQIDMDLTAGNRASGTVPRMHAHACVRRYTPTGLFWLIIVWHGMAHWRSILFFGGIGLVIRITSHVHIMVLECLGLAGSYNFHFRATDHCEALLLGPSHIMMRFPRYQGAAVSSICGILMYFDEGLDLDFQAVRLMR